MLARGPELLSEARAAARAVPAFTVYTLESIRAVCDAAEHTGLPVILQAGSSSYRETSRPMLAAAALAQGSDDIRQVQREAVRAMADVAADKLTLLGGGGQTSEHAAHPSR
jgi:fructose/tagatose bisphosphate aldolase